MQTMNSALHSEPLASLVYGLYWSLVWILSFPVVLSVLWGRTIGRILVALLWPEAATAYDPSKKGKQQDDPEKRQELAVVITGCDTGFGRELALRAADQGYIVFAGCLDSESSWGKENGSDFATILTKGTIVPLPMDVTKDDQVQNAVAKVTAWLQEKPTTTQQPPPPPPTTTTTPKRILHAVINNAGVGVGGLVDWTDLSTFQYCLDGMCCAYKELFPSGARCCTPPLACLTFYTPPIFSNCFWAKYSQLLGYDSSVQGLFAIAPTTSRSKSACPWRHAHFECDKHGGSRGQWHVGPVRLRRIQARGQCLFVHFAHRAGGVWHCRHYH
jgi:hypothetical protein